MNNLRIKWILMRIWRRIAIFSCRALSFPATILLGERLDPKTLCQWLHPIRSKKLETRFQQEKEQTRPQTRTSAKQKEPPEPFFSFPTIPVYDHRANSLLIEMKEEITQLRNKMQHIEGKLEAVGLSSQDLSTTKTKPQQKCQQSTEMGG